MNTSAQKNPARRQGEGSAQASHPASATATGTTMTRTTTICPKMRDSSSRSMALLAARHERIPTQDKAAERRKHLAGHPVLPSASESASRAWASRARAAARPVSEA